MRLLGINMSLEFASHDSFQIEERNWFQFTERARVRVRSLEKAFQPFVIRRFQ